MSQILQVGGQPQKLGQNSWFRPLGWHCITIAWTLKASTVEHQVWIIMTTCITLYNYNCVVYRLLHKSTPATRRLFQFNNPNSLATLGLLQAVISRFPVWKCIHRWENQPNHPKAANVCCLNIFTSHCQRFKLLNLQYNNWWINWINPQMCHDQQMADCMSYAHPSHIRNPSNGYINPY